MPVWTSCFTFRLLHSVYWIRDNDCTCGLTVTSRDVPAEIMCTCFHFSCLAGPLVHDFVLFYSVLNEAQPWRDLVTEVCIMQSCCLLFLSMRKLTEVSDLHADHSRQCLPVLFWQEGLIQVADRFGNFAFLVLARFFVFLSVSTTNWLLIMSLWGFSFHNRGLPTGILVVLIHLDV